MRLVRIFPTLIVLAALGVPLAAGADEALTGEGKFEFFVDVASLPVPGEKTLELFQVAIPTKEVAYRETDGRFEASVRIRLTLSLEGTVVYDKAFGLRDARSERPVEDDLSGFIYFTDSLLVDPGQYSLDVTVEDLNRREKSLFGMIKDRHLQSEIREAVVVVADFGTDRLALGDPVLVWRFEPDGSWVPNPIRIYGLKNDTLSLFVSVLAPQRSIGDSLALDFYVVDRRGDVLAEERVESVVDDRRKTIFARFDVNTFPADTYRLFVDAFTGSGETASSGKDFSVAWQLVNWRKPRRDVMTEARIVLSGSDFQIFRQKSIGEQEQMLSRFWRENDPTPSTAYNETYEVFRERVARADRTYGWMQRGALSDRGQIFIRFGPPDEIVQQVLPKTRDELESAIDMLEDEFQVVVFSSATGPEADELRLVDNRTRSRFYRGSEGHDTGGYELWVYTGNGDPIFKRDMLMTIHAGLRYLFIDKDGVGNYRLAADSEEFQVSE
ncbi:MAG: GWxTD domain-containing protein [Candidatus Krumholzibacteriota bacterium]|nr:GWxTD domain-containing protein [Candidatus Krumholzibacteriota bacterium]